MNWDRIEGNWRQFKRNVREQWGNLTDDQPDVIAGRRDRLVGRQPTERKVSEWVVRKRWISPGNASWVRRIAPQGRP